MEKSYIMGIDEGTGSVRTMIFDEEGKIVAEAARELTQHCRAGWVKHDPMEILGVQLETTMRRVLGGARLSPEDIRSIGLTNQRETALVWDKNTGEPVYDAIVWTSRQTADVIEDWAAEGLNDDILQKTGVPNEAYFSASKVAWILENVEGTRQKAERGRLLADTIDAWLMWNLTGRERFVTEYSNASRTMAYDELYPRWRALNDHLLEAAERSLATNLWKGAGA
jgi:glycerol kinase